MKFPKPQPHGPITDVFPDVFVVRGSIRFMPLLSVARNMTIVREGGELTLINSVRLNAAGEAQLRSLGAIKRLVRIGNFHGMDDPYYARQLGAEYWAPAGVTLRDGVAPARELAEDAEPPIVDASVFQFRATKQPEAALLLRRAGGILVTCDSVQNWTDHAGCSWLGAQFMRRNGYHGGVLAGPFWQKIMAREEGPPLRTDFERLLQLEFRHLLSGHGEPLRDRAKADLTDMVARTFPA